MFHQYLVSDSFNSHKGNQPMCEVVLTFAEVFAKKCHEGQSRKNGNPYIQHAKSVREILKDLGCSALILDVAILHDVLEECTDIDLKTIFKLFGEDCGAMVCLLSKKPKEFFTHFPNPKQARLSHYVDNFKEGAKIYSQILLVKLADQIDNLESLHVFDFDKQKEQVREIEEHFIPIYQKNKEFISGRNKKAYTLLYRQLCESIKAWKLVFVDKKKSRD